VDPHDPNRIDPASRREVLRIAHPLHDHVMGQIGFNPTAVPSDPDYGMLYIAVGDGGNTWFGYKEVDAWRNAQNMGNPFGKLLRINPLRNGADKYSVPADNPFVGSSGLKLIWALGLRNPQRFSWDTQGDHKLILVDVGQAEVEEVNVGAAGANYGWSEREGIWAVNHADEHQLSQLPPDDASLGFTYPAAQYRHDVGKAIAGGFVYRGRLVPALQGAYVFGDIVTGRIFRVSANQLANGRLSEIREVKLHYYGRHGSLHDILDGEGRIDLRFGVDEQGEIYLLTQRDGMIRKLSMSVAPSVGSSSVSQRARP
jgi:glucose/arabinose dehydrogenase